MLELENAPHDPPLGRSYDPTRPLDQTDTRMNWPSWSGNIETIITASQHQATLYRICHRSSELHNSRNAPITNSPDGHAFSVSSVNSGCVRCLTRTDPTGCACPFVAYLSGAAQRPAAVQIYLLSCGPMTLRRVGPNPVE